MARSSFDSVQPPRRRSTLGRCCHGRPTMLVVLATLPLCASTTPSPPPASGCQDWACQELNGLGTGWQRNAECCSVSDRGRCTPGHGLYQYIRAEQCIRGCANFFCCSYSSTPPPGLRLAHRSSLPRSSDNACPLDPRRGAAGLLFLLLVLGGTVYFVRRIRRRQHERWEQHAARQQAAQQAREARGQPVSGTPVQGYALNHPETAQGVVQGAPVAQATAVPAVGDGSNVVHATVVQAVAVPVARQDAM